MSVDLRNSLFMTNSLVILDWTYPLDLPLSLGLALIPWTCPYPFDLPLSLGLALIPWTCPYPLDMPLSLGLALIASILGKERRT